MKKWTEKRLVEEIKAVVKKLELNRLPSVKEFKEHANGGYDAINKLGGFPYFSKLLNLPTAKTSLKYTHTCQVCGKEFQTIRESSRFCSQTCRNKHNAKCVICGTPTGGGSYCSDICRMIAARQRGKVLSNYKGVSPSRAFQKEREARKRGLHFSDFQKADTLDMAGSIDTSKYGVEKVKVL